MPNDTGSPNAASPNPGDDGNGGGGPAAWLGLSYFEAIIKASSTPEKVAALSVLIIGLVGFGLLKGSGGTTILVGFCILVVGIIRLVLILRPAAERVQTQFPMPQIPPAPSPNVGVDIPAIIEGAMRPIGDTTRWVAEGTVANFWALMNGATWLAQGMPSGENASNPNRLSGENVHGAIEHTPPTENQPDG